MFRDKKKYAWLWFVRLPCCHFWNNFEFLMRLNKCVVSECALEMLDCVGQWDLEREMVGDAPTVETLVHSEPLWKLYRTTCHATYVIHTFVVTFINDVGAERFRVHLKKWLRHVECGWGGGHCRWRGGGHCHWRSVGDTSKKHPLNRPSLIWRRFDQGLYSLCRLHFVSRLSNKQDSLTDVGCIGNLRKSRTNRCTDGQVNKMTNHKWRGVTISLRTGGGGWESNPHPHPKKGLKGPKINIFYIFDIFDI